MPLTIPNLLTIGRVVAAPLVIAVFLIISRPAADWIAFLLFAVAARTAFLDGRLARKWGQVSGFGRMLDPIADKEMVMVAGALLLTLYELDPLVAAPLTLILMREVLVSGLREYLNGAEILSVTTLAKWKTTARMVAIGLLLLGGAVDSVVGVGIALLWVAAIMTVITGWDYFAKCIAYIRSEEERR